MSTEKEIRLRELNLTHLAKARIKKLEWFYDHKIPIVEIETVFYIVPEHINLKEFQRRFSALNIELKFLQAQIEWFKEMGLALSLDGNRYIFKGEKQGFDPSKRLEYKDAPELFWCIPDQHRETQIQKLYDYIAILKEESLVDLEKKNVNVEQKEHERKEIEDDDNISEES